MFVIDRQHQNDILDTHIANLPIRTLMLHVCVCVCVCMRYMYMCMHLLSCICIILGHMTLMQ